MTARTALVALLLASCAPAGAAQQPRSAPHLSEVLARADARVVRRVAELPDLRPLPTGGADRTLAPYFAVTGADSEGERLPLEETRADVHVAGVIAQVKVTQVFRNRGVRPIEAVYVFPASTRAAVHGMRLRIGERTIEARVDRRAKARADYAAARTDGKRAALLEQQRPNVFTMQVANVMPGDRIVAELDYSELIVPEEGVYELVTPAVVGPRYPGGADPVEDRWIANPYLHEGEAEPYRFSFAARLDTALALREVSSPSHALAVSYASPSSAEVKLAQAGGGDRDVVLRWRLAGDRVEAGVLLFPGEHGGGWFLAQVEPPARVKASDVPPREVVFVLDVSGSMHGFPLDTAKALVRSLLPKLRPVDRFDVVFFSGGSRVLSPEGSLPATPENVRRALEALDAERGAGGTELLDALRTAYDLPRADRSVARSIVLVTDGYVAAEAPAFRLVRERLDEASCFTFGIGSSVNRALVEMLARAGQAEPFVVLAPPRAQAAADRLERILSSPVLSRMAVRFDGLAARDVAPAKLPDLLAERPVVLFGRYDGAPRGRIVLAGESAHGRFERTLDFGVASPRAENAPLRTLWARRWVEILEDEHALAPAKEVEDAIADLGLAHHLLTPFTSFVAIDSEIVNRGGAGDRIAQPLPLPRGVSDLAVGERQATGAPGGAPGRRTAKEAAFPASDRAGPGFLGAASLRSFAAPAPAARVRIERDAPAALSGVPALREAIARALATVAAGGHRGRVDLRLTIGADGRVVTVSVRAAPDAATRDAIVRALHGLASGAVPAGRREGVYGATVWLG